MFVEVISDCTGFPEVIDVVAIYFFITRANQIINLFYFNNFNLNRRIESDSELSDIISTSIKRKQLLAIDSEDNNSDCDEIVFPLRKRCTMMSDDEEESDNENCEINLIVKEWIWGHRKRKQNMTIFTNFWNKNKN